MLDRLFDRLLSISHEARLVTLRFGQNLESYINSNQTNEQYSTTSECSDLKVFLAALRYTHV